MFDPVFDPTGQFIGDPAEALRRAREALEKQAHDEDPAVQARLRENYVKAAKARGLPIVLFKGGPYDGKVYTGDKFPAVGEYGVWDDEVERNRGTLIQLVRHVYLMSWVDGQLVWVFDRSENGPTKPGEAYQSRR